MAQFRVDFGLAIILTILSQEIQGAGPQPHKLVCLYNSSSFVKEGLGKFTTQDLEQGLSLCTHLVYGYAGIDILNGKCRSLNEGLDLDQGKGHFRTITTLKRRYPNLKILLGVGGGADPNSQLYLQLLERNDDQTAFINSAYTLLKTYDFDGIDLAWQFPADKPKRIRSSIGSFWYSVKKTVGAAGKPLDENAETHRNGFVRFSRELKNAFRHDNYILSLTINPNVNASLFIDIPEVAPHYDIIQLATYDFQTPARNPHEADFPSPIYELNERLPQNNINFQVQHWLANSIPASKLLICIPAFGRTWKLETDSTQTGVPPILETEESGPEGVQSKEAGRLNWPETCAKLPNPSNANLKGDLSPLRKVSDPTKRFGNYAYRLPDSDGNYGLWVGYEDADTAATKTSFALSKNLGGVCIHDLSSDDFRGACSGEKFPILRAIKYLLRS
jgi:GH18 family chitinase